MTAAHPGADQPLQLGGVIETPAPPEPGVRIWTATFDSLTNAELAALEDVLDPPERARAARFHFAHDRQHYLAARGILRELLGAALKISPKAVQFVYGDRGKPGVVQNARDGRRLRFNLSHSSGYAMIATAWDREIGIDLEAITRLDPDQEHLSGLAGRVLSSREFVLWRALPDDASRHRAFLRAWTRKEAYAKATGTGVFDGLREVEVSLDAAAPERSLIINRPAAQAPAGWTLYDLTAPPGFAAVLALARAET